ncbi:TrbI/VirB10 family protein [Croceicoccus hydrothermalis]|uniref:TrbI/VirB10 family protein n=1 Tax=Croceicoccus hydrothermalis TaxID=2867964 RepID=UPI001EFAAFD1|nr:TrbI/VirB10 family protein [Croceicoccus hydrothermalis]
MRLAARLPADPANDVDPRETESAEIIDLASRNSFPAVTQRKGKSDGLGLAAGVAIVGLLGAFTLWGMNSARIEEPAAPAPVAAAPVETAAPVDTPLIVPDTPPIDAPYAMQQPDPGPAPVLSAPPQMDTGPASNPYSSPTLVFDAGSAYDAVEDTGTPYNGENASTGNSASDFASRIGGVGGGPAQAARMVDPGTTVTQGTLIPAILETAIDTDVPGYVRAVVSQDVKSFDGRRVLVPRSSRLIGQYQSGLQAGQKRAYVIWTRLIRPDGVSVNIGSPATGFDGTTGLRGKVDSHFFKRFGSAMLLSVVGGLSAMGTGGASVVLGGGQSAAAAAVEENSKIGPTVRVRQGEPIRVFTARDLDFSTVTK